MKIKIEGVTGTRLNITSGYGKIGRQFISALNPDNSDGDVSLYVTPPYSVKLSKKFNVIYTMHELDTLPPEKQIWIKNLNEYDLVIVPSEWIKRNFIKFGVTVPIEVVPLGVDPLIFKGTKTSFFSILTCHSNFGSSSSRENWMETLECYCKVFAGHKDTMLWIKTWDYPTGRLDEFMNDIAKRNNLDTTNLPPVEILFNEFTDEQLNDLYSKSWLFIKNANREGWSLPLHEALSTGVNCLYRNLPSLKWVENYNNVVKFSNTYELKSLMKTLYHVYEIDKQRKDKNDIRNISLMIQQVIEKYYGKN